MTDFLLRARLLARKGVAAALVGSLAVLVGAGIAVSFRPPLVGPEDPPLPPSQSSTRQYVNADAGYAFRYPLKWKLTERGTASELVSPKRDVLVSFGLAPSGGLRRASNSFVASLRKVYRRVRLVPTRSREIGGRTALVRSGTAINDAGVRIRFIAAVTPGPGVRHAIAAFTSGGFARAKVARRLQRVLNSFDAVAPNV